MNHAVFRDFGAAPSEESGQLGICGAITICAVLSFAYTILVVLGLHFGGVIEEMTKNWIAICAILTNAGQIPADEAAFNAALYRNIALVSVGIASLLFFSLRKARARWATKKMRVFWRVCENGRHEELARTGYYQMGLGVIAMAFLLFLGDPARTEPSGLFSQPWSYLRVPLLATLALAFACNAASLRLAARIAAN
jgi:hypothetical protein